jgi:nicotinamidase-related amidase
MPETNAYLRSHELMGRDDTALVVIDVQEKLIPLIPGFERIVWNIGRLIDSAKILQMPVLGTEQYTKGLGRTVTELAERTGPLVEKASFSCWACEPFRAKLVEMDVPKVLLVGIEAHVCIEQTALDLLAAGYRVYLAVDAIGARFDIDCQTALRRMDSAGASLTTTEAAIFEWCAVAGTPEFKQLSALIKQSQTEGK